MSRAGKLTVARIDTERYVKTSQYSTFVDKGKRTGVTIMPDGDEVPSGAFVEHPRGPISLHKSVVNTGHRIIHATALHRSRSIGSLWRDKNTGSIYVAEDKLEEFFYAAMKLRKYTDQELIAMNHPDKDGWKKHDLAGIPLGKVKERIAQIQGSPEQWLHFDIPQAVVKLALFFSPQKDRWFYIELNPETGQCRRTLVYGSKNVAEFKRRKRILTWVPLTSKQPIQS